MGDTREDQRVEPKEPIVFEVVISVNGKPKVGKIKILKIEEAKKVLYATG